MDILSKIFNVIGTVLKTILPPSPFDGLLSKFAAIPYLGYLNWFVPVGEILSVLLLWLGAYGLFLLYSIFMRWLKVIGD